MEKKYILIDGILCPLDHITGKEYIAGDNITFAPDEDDPNVIEISSSEPVYVGATDTEDGKAGVVPPALTGDTDKYLRGDGTWGSPEGTKDYEDLDNKPTINDVELIGNLTSEDLGLYVKPEDGIPASDLADDVLPKEMVGATDTDNGESGLVPAPTSAEKDNFLRGDGTWAAISKDGTEMVGATDLADGKSGLVPVPVAGDNDKVLYGDGVWSDIPSIPIANINNLFT